MEAFGALTLQIAMGIGLAACAGLRAFLPPFVVSLAGKMEWVPLADRFDWLASWPAVTVFGVAVAAEFLADKIPVVDHTLDLLEGWLKPIAGALLAVVVLTEMSPLEATVLGIMAGASTAGAVHVAKAKLRLVSSALTAGLGNPVLSLGEDAVALTGSILSLVFPLLLAGVVIVSTMLVYVVFWRSRVRAARAGS